MVFSDLLFIFVFLPLFILTYIGGYYIDRLRIRRAQSLDGDEPIKPMLMRNISLVVFSVLFYSWGEPVYILLMIASVIINYICGLGIASASSQRRSKLWLFAGVSLNLLILGSFKYLGFFAEGLVQIGIPVSVPRIALPIGISFYIFQSISYLIDVQRKDAPVQKNFMDLLLYIAMFPQLIAGPIVRYGTVAQEINLRHTDAEHISTGSFRFLIGLAKKVIFANIFGEIATELLQGEGVSELSTAGAWVGIIAFTLQIYFDFSGYSDMAIGLGRSVGFHFPENFNHPYISKSMTEFWRRWHMSLGSFFRDYVYIPMGGNRRHQPINIMTVWFLTGMWHGASWNFIIWGLYYGLIIMIEKYTLLRWKIPSFLLHIYSILLIVIGWALFYFDDMNRLGQFFYAFFGLGRSQGLPFYVESLLVDNIWIWIAAIILCMPVRNIIADRIDTAVNRPNRQRAKIALFGFRALASILILIVCITLLVGATNNAFLYTRF